jgi:hypothetical protein
MIFAEMEYDQHYDDMHEPLLQLLKSRFKRVESGHQGDSWIRILAGEEKVVIDTFSSMKHQIKSENINSTLVKIVIQAIQEKYMLIVFNEPKLECHEE